MRVPPARICQVQVEEHWPSVYQKNALSCVRGTSITPRMRRVVESTFDVRAQILSIVSKAGVHDFYLVIRARATRIASSLDPRAESDFVSALAPTQFTTSLLAALCAVCRLGFAKVSTLKIGREIVDDTQE